MALTLHSAFIPSVLQIIGSVANMVNQAEAWCDENGHAHDEILNARLIEDMLPFAKQVASCRSHSIRAIEGLRTGVFTPDMSPPPSSFDELRELLSKTIAELGDVSSDDLEEWGAKDMQFQVGDQFKLDFVGQDFLLTLSQPNFYFHATTAYDILRMKGVPLGKRDYLGALRLKV